MRKQPGVHSDTGKMARDLLYQDYIHRSAVDHHQMWLDWGFQLLLQSKEIKPGLNAELRFIIPHQSSSKVELRYFDGLSGITTGISLSKHPQLNFSGILGNRLFGIGTDICFDTKTATFAKCDASLSFYSSILNASLTLTEKCHSLHVASYLPTNFPRDSAFAAEMTHRFLSNQTSITLGTKFSPTPSTVVKARACIDGSIGALLQQQLFPAFFVTIEGEINVKDIKRSARMGLTCSLKYKMR